MADDLPLTGFKPRSKLVTKQTEITRPRFPVIDAHLHLAPPYGQDWLGKPVAELIETLDAAHIEAVVDLDGGWGEDILDTHLKHFKEQAPDRFVHFGGVEWSRWAEHGDRFGEWAASRFRAQVARGAQGLKIWKPLGLHVRDQHGVLVAVDDERLDPLWAVVGELNVPIIIHVADPVAFFEPLDVHNERWEELQANPQDQFPSPPFPAFIDILEAFARVVRRHPQTTFIGAHVGCYAENLSWVGALLDDCPNFYVDISSRVGELGRQPYGARRFFLRYADRILFGTDADAKLTTYQRYYRFLETDDEYFSHNYSDPPWQGRWYVYGLFLPDEVLRKVYAENARRVIFKS
jgi:predicted TIM-barrel fold metal-dependent hydrolase